MSDRFLVTGAAGFVGMNLVKHLAEQGRNVRAMVRREEQKKLLTQYTDDVVVGDVTKPETLKPAMEGIAGVHHIAATFRQGSTSEAVFQAVNVDGVANTLDAAIEAGVERFILCSTNGVHSHVANPPADENAPFKPGDPYQASKLEGEKIAMKYFSEGRIRGVVLRPAMIYGPGDQRTLKLFKMISEGSFFYVGSGKAFTHWVDVRDVAAAFDRAMEAKEINAEAFLIAGGEYRTLQETVETISEQLGVRTPKIHLPVAPVMALAYVTEVICQPLKIEPPIFRRRVHFFLKNRAFDTRKAQTMLGFTPRQDFPSEIRDIIAGYVELGMLKPPKNAETT